MDCNKSDLPKDLSPKTGAGQKKLLNTKPKIDSPLLPKINPDSKREEELSAKEQEIRRKFKEKINKLKKMPMPPQPTINVNSEGLTEGELIIENVKRKFKQIFSKFYKESLPSATPEIEKSIEKKKSDAIKVCVGTKPIHSAIYRFACVLPIKRASKKIESMICKSVGFLPEQYVNNNQLLLLSKDKQEKSANSSTATGNSDQNAMPPNKNEKGNRKSTEKAEEKNKINPELTSPNLNLKSESFISATSCKPTTTDLTLPAAETSTVQTSTATSSPTTDMTTSIIEQLNKSIAAAQAHAKATSNITKEETPKAATSNTMAAQTQEWATSNTTPSETLLSATAPPEALAAAQAPAAPAPSATDAAKLTAEAASTATTASTATATSAEAKTSTIKAVSTAETSTEATTTPPPKQFYSSSFHAHSDEQILLRKTRKASEPAIDLAPDDVPKSKNVTKPLDQPMNKIELVKKSKFLEPMKKIEPTPQPEIVEPIQTSPLISLLKAFNLDKIFKSLSDKSGHKQKLVPISVINKIPIRLKQGFLVIGTFIPLYYTYHKIVTDNELTLKLAEEN